jgi:hypothetical protein
MESPIKLSIAIAACALTFGAGLFTGRLFPAHHYERFGQSIYLFDTSSGKFCMMKQAGTSPPDGIVWDETKDAVATKGLYPVCGE